MGIVKKGVTFTKKGLGLDKPTKKEESKATHFLTGLKEWVMSPGGIITVIAVIALVIYVNHKTK